MHHGDPLPDHVTAYQDGVRYRDAQALARVRAQAIAIVDGRCGYAIELAPDPAAHELDYQEEADKIWAARDGEAVRAKARLESTDRDPRCPGEAT